MIAHLRLSLSLASALAFPAAAQAPKVDLILIHGRIFTGNTTHPWAEALAISGDRIIAVGTTADVERRRTAATRTLDLGGRTVIPGLNDAHIHIGLGSPGAEVTTSTGPMPDPDRRQIVDSLRAAVARFPADTWLLVAVASTIFDDALARRAWLDSLAPRHPVALYAWTGNGAVFNSRALEQLGITDATPDPLGGWFERGPDGRLTGLAHGYAKYFVDPYRLHPLPSGEQLRRVRGVLNQAAAFGLTTLQDMEATEPEVSARVFAAEDSPVRVRVISTVHTTSSGRRLGASVAPGRPRQIGPVAYASGVKYILDGTPVERRALMRRPYSDRPAQYGHFNFPPDTVRTILREGLASGEQLMLHAVGDSAIALLLDLMTELAPDSVWRARRLRIEHGDGLAPDLIPRVKRLGVIVVQNPAHLTVGQLREVRLGAARAREFQPMKTLLDAGIPLALGSDGPLNPFLNIMFAVTFPGHPGDALTLEQALRAYTWGSAYAERMEHEKGILAPGMLADLAVLSQDIFSLPPAALPRTTSVLTLVGGRVVHDAGIVTAR